MTTAAGEHTEVQGEQTAEQEAPTAGTSGKSGGAVGAGGAGAAVSTPKFVALSTYYLKDVDPKLQRAVYDEVSDAVLKNQLMGMHQRGSDVRFPALNGTQGKALREILLKNTPDLHDRLDQLMIAAISKQVVRTGAKGLSVDALEELGDQLDFDKMVLEARKLHKAQSRVKGKAKG